ncbi:MAG: thiol-disulfide oxidoreductase [Halieaceae bacterium]|nr:thiol-disulfide oxidoreductase [Halieaceae bacterium]
MATLPVYELANLDGVRVSSPKDEVALVCFIKEDCPTCKEAMPVLDAFFAHYGEHMPVQVIGQTLEGNRALASAFSPSFSILDDSALQVSFAADIQTVPTLLRLDANGKELSRLVGFVRDEWQIMASELDALTGQQSVSVNWSDLPVWRPGCGSLSVDPSNEPRLRAMAEGSPIRARRIDVGSQDDEFEFMFDQGFSDGLPLVPPTPERVLAMLAGTSRDAQEVLGEMAPNMGTVTVEKVAINSVMAGCKPEYLPVVLAATEAILTDDYNIHGVMATTMGASPVLVVNGPIRHRIGMNMGLGSLGQGNRANLTIGRALRLVVRNVGGAKPGKTERSTLGNPMKLTMCFAEWEERNPWLPLHVERGFSKDESVVTVFTMSSGPTLIIDQDSRSASQLAGTLGQGLQAVLSPKAYGATDCLLVVVPEHVDTLMRDNYSKADLRRRIQEVSSRPLRDLVADARSGTGIKSEVAAQMDEATLNKLVSKFKSDDDIHIVVAGSEAGKFSGAFHGWVTGSVGSIPVSRKIEH